MFGRAQFEFANATGFHPIASVIFLEFFHTSNSTKSRIAITAARNSKSRFDRDFFHTFALCLALTVSFFVTRIQKSVKRRSKKHFTKNFSSALDHISYRNCREANHRIEDITAMQKKSVTIIKQTNRFFKVINLIEESFN